ncbi:hypothetical protein IRY61_06585 [Candidatus Saccharibacteria bacterium]|nr:hypothetical protein [Candidatus Saccharibacteria bacterium]
MGANLHVCFEGGVVDLGHSQLAAEVLTRDTTLPDRLGRELIARMLLQEAADDGVLKELLVHAGQVALMQQYPDGLAGFMRGEQ